MKKQKKASDIYKRQNVLIHKAFAASGMPYAEHKEEWLELIRSILETGNLKLEREITGLSELTLWERHQVIVHFQGRGMRIFSPSVPANVRDWKKGDPDIEYEYRVDADPQIRMVYAMWVEMGYQPKTLRGLCLKMFKRDDPRWLTDEQLSRLVNVVKYRAEKKGCGNYYRRKVG